MRTPLPWVSFLLTGWILAVTVACGSTLATAAPPSLAEAQAVPRYDRAEFGDGWADLDRDCQDSRQEVLIRDLVDETFDRDGCKVLTGTLHDAYTGATIHFVRGAKTSDDVQIDHIVSLKSAWEMGAWRWSDADREAFANDERELIAVDGRTNNAKSDSGPAEWLPPNIAAHCAYAQDWAEVLRRYDLTPTAADAAVLAEINEECNR